MVHLCSLEVWFLLPVFPLTFPVPKGAIMTADVVDPKQAFEFLWGNGLYPLLIGFVTAQVVPEGELAEFTASLQFDTAVIPERPYPLKLVIADLRQTFYLRLLQTWGFERQDGDADDEHEECRWVKGDELIRQTTSERVIVDFEANDAARESLARLHRLFVAALKVAREQLATLTDLLQDGTAMCSRAMDSAQTLASRALGESD